jgi:urea transport system permease protein
MTDTDLSAAVSVGGAPKDEAPPSASALRFKTYVEWAGYAAFIAVILVLPLFIDEFELNRLAKYLVYGMLGVAIALSWGYAGILNLGQGLFFGAGAYMIAMSLKLASPTSLAQGSDTPIPDFMLWNADPHAPVELCCINPASFLWLPFQATWFGVVMGIILPVVIATVVGLTIFKKRVSGVYISIITLALVLLVRLVVIDAQPVTNGFNGLTDLSYLTVFGLEFDPYFAHTYYLVAILLSLVLVGARMLVSTRAGLILQAIRDDQNRVRYLGFDVPVYQTVFFAISAAIAGLAGMLYVIVAEFASPTFMDLAFSITMVVWAAVGGRSSLLGACIGAILINTIEASVSETQALVQAWQVIIGLLFVLVVLFLPRGLAGLSSDLVDLVLRLFNRRRPVAPQPAGEAMRPPVAAE